MALKLTLKNNYWHVTGTIMLPTGESRRVRKSTGYSKYQKQYASAVMSRILDEAMKEKTTPGDEAVTVDDAVELYFKRPEGVGATDRFVLIRFEDAFRGRSLKGLALSELTRYVQGRGNTASTVAREVNSINAVFAYAKANGLEVPDGLRMKRPTVDDSRMRWLTMDDRDAFIESCDPKVKDLVTFLFYTGARLGEAFDLRWKNVGEGQVYLATRKGRQKTLRWRAIPVSAPIAKMLDGGGRGEDFVFQNGGKQWNRHAFYPHWKRACKSAGVEDFRPHDCRHTFASLLIQHGVGLREIADLLGHSQLSMVMRYSHLAPTQLRSAVDLLASNGGQDSDKVA